MKEIM